MNQSFVQVVGSGSKSIQDFFLLEYTIRYENGSHLAVVGYLPIIDTVMGMSPLLRQVSTRSCPSLR